MFGLMGCGNAVNVKGHKLTGYEYSCGGGMTGGARTVEVLTISDETHLVFRNAETWAEDARVTEYLVENSIFDSLEAVFSKYGMNKWNQKKFTNMFVSDGESSSYTFIFDNGVRVYFSSQIYPEQYSRKLAELSKVIDNYKASATLLPGLVVKEKSDEELLYKNHPDNGKVEIEIFSYYAGRVKYRVMNGTDEAVEVAYTTTLVYDADGSVCFNDESDSSYSLDANSAEEHSIKIGSSLKAGQYTLKMGAYEGRFEIK